MSDSYKYTNETINRDAGSGADDQVWHQPKTKEYFDNCFEQFSVFNLVSTALATGLLDFINDDDHTGAEADASKAFVNEKIYNSLVTTVRAVQTLQGMMQGAGFEEGKTSLLEDFKETLEEDDTAIIKASKLKSVIDDFINFYKTFNTCADEIHKQRDEAKRIIDGCSITSGMSVKDPSPTKANNSFKEFASEDGTEGMVPKFRKAFLDFIDAHNNDFSGSDYETMIDAINKNLDAILAGLGDGSFDPDAFEKQLKDIVYDEGGETGDYDTYIDTYTKYLKGKEPRSQVYKYDPINMNNGNFISSKTDLSVYGAHNITVKRFYNAQSEVIGAMGRGWTLNYEEHLSRSGDGFKLYFEDGKEGVYKKTTLGSDEVYMEIHGEPGVLTETGTGFKLTLDDGAYKEYDKDGYIVAFGNCSGRHTTVEYNIFSKGTNEKGEENKVALPVRVNTIDGNYVAFSYNDRGLLILAKDHAGREVAYRYEDPTDSYRLTTVVAPNGTERTYSYTEDGLIGSSTRPDGVVGVTNEYDKAHRIIRQTMPDGGVYNFSYDDKEHITHAVEPNGLRVDYISDELGRHVGTRYPDLGVMERFSYNAKGQKISHTDKNGYTTRYTYDNRGHVTSIIGPEGHSEFFTYNAEGRLYSRKDAEGNVTKFTYDLDGNLYAVTSPLGEKVKLDYEDGRVVAVRNAEGQIISFTYDEKGNISSIVDPAGVRTEYECDSLGRVTATRNADGAVTRYEIDEADNITRVTDPEGNVTSYEYNKLGQVSGIINPDGTRKTWQYGINGKPSAYIDEDDRTTRVYYNTTGKEERIILPNNGSISYEYDLSGNMTKVIDPDGNETSFTYDNEGHVLSISKGDDEIVAVAAFTYDGLGRKTSESDGNGNVLHYEYDKNGNVIAVTDALGGVVRKEYDAIGRLVKETDQLDRETLYAYDRNGNNISVTEASGVVTLNTYVGNRLVKVAKVADDKEQTFKTIAYDNCGRISEVTEADGYRIAYGYNKNGEIVSVSGSDGRVLKYGRDSRGRVIEVNDCGKVTTFSYTGTGKIKSVTDSLGNRAEYTYNALDLVETIERFGDEKALFPKVDEAGHITSFEYDMAGRLVSVTDAHGNKDTYSYDALGFLKTHVDRDGFETVYTRDGNGNVTGIDYKDGKSVRLNYNALNILEEVQDYLGLTRIESDILGRTSKVTDYKGRTVSYEYGAHDQRTAVVYPDGTRAEYKYDGFGRLTNLNDVSYEYDQYGRLSGKNFPNGIKASYEYYQGGLLKTATSRDSQGVLDEYLYQYDSSSKLTDISRNRRGMDAVSGAYHYEYDDLGRLTQSTLDGQLVASYGYDAFGNRTQMTSKDVQVSYEYDSLDRLTTAIIRDSSKGEVINTYSYDNRGNRTAMRVGDVIKKAFDFDARGNMISAKDADNGSISYTYDGLGHRVGAATPEEKVEYLVDVSKRYHNLLERYVNGVSERFVYDDEVLSMNREGNEYYYLQDELGSTMYMTGTDGCVVNAYAYDDFGRNIDPYTGKLIENSRAYTRNGNVIQPFAFTGYQEDNISGLRFAQARYYDPQTGRFNAEDNVRGFIDDPVTLNHYIYCFNNPIEYVDLDGNFASLKEGLSNLGSAIKQGINDNRQLIGAGITILGAVGGVVATVALTPYIGPVGARAVGGAISGGLTDLGAQVSQNGTDVNWGQVGLNALGGAASAAIPGGGVVGALKDAAIDGLVEVGSQLVRGESLDFREVGKTMAISFGVSAVSDMFGNFFNRRRNQEIGLLNNRKADIEIEIDEKTNLLDNLKSPNRVRKTKNSIKALKKELEKIPDLIKDIELDMDIVQIKTGNLFSALTNILINSIAYEVC